MEYEEILNEINQVFSSSDLRGTRESKMQVINFVKELQTENRKLKEALTPSGETKTFHIGEYEFTQEMYGYDEDGEPNEGVMFCQIPWTSVKDIMKGIVKDSGVKL